MNINKQKQIDELDKLIGITNDIFENDEDLSEVEKPPKEKKPLLVITDDRGPDDLTPESFLDDMKRDYIDTRNTLKNLISKGQAALDGVIDVAEEGEHPRSFEVAATLITTIAKVSESLLELQKTVRSLTIQASEGSSGVGTQKPTDNSPNVLVTGTFDDILKMLDSAKDKKEKEESIVSNQ